MPPAVMVFYRISKGELNSLKEALDNVLEDYFETTELLALKEMLEEILAGMPLEEQKYE